MKGSVKANLVIFLIIAVFAFIISSTFSSLTVVEDHDSYKLSSIANDSFEPNQIDEVPTIIPKVKTNLTNNTTDNKTIEKPDDNWTDILNETIEGLEDW